MPRVIRRIKYVRMCDLVIVSLVCANIVCVVYYRSTDMASHMIFQDDDVINMNSDAAAASSQRSERSELEVALKNILPDVTSDESVPDEKDEVTQRAKVKVLEPCPDVPPSLVGELACDCNGVTSEFLSSHYPQLEPGGRLRPRVCKPGQRLALIIPYRDRYNHLHSLLNMLIPILMRQQADVTFFVIEQTNSTYFNRAALHNIGFLEAVKTADFDCFIFQDVDLVPLNDFHLYRCGPSPIHLSSKIQSSQWTAEKEMYKEYTGGVIAMTRQQYQKINGNSNLYFGWGGEDDDLYERLLNKKMKRVRANKAYAIYRMLKHESQEGKGENPQRFKVLKTARQRQDVEGLNTCKYKVNEIRLEHLYTWINVSLNSTEILMTAPSNTLQDIMNELAKRQK